MDRHWTKNKPDTYNILFINQRRDGRTAANYACTSRGTRRAANSCSSELPLPSRGANPAERISQAAITWLTHPPNNCHHPFRVFFIALAVWFSFLFIQSRVAGNLVFVAGVWSLFFQLSSFPNFRSRAKKCSLTLIKKGENTRMLLSQRRRKYTRQIFEWLSMSLKFMTYNLKSNISIANSTNHLKSTLLTEANKPISYPQ